MIELQTSDQSVLIVDDDQLVVQSLRKCLLSTARLRFAMNGEAALAQMREATPDLVMLDVHMPGLSGFDVLEMMNADPALQEVPVIMITSEADPQQEQAGLDRGAVDFIAKPLSPGVVLARVRTQLRLASANAALKSAAVVDRLKLASTLADLRESHAVLETTARQLTEANQSLLQFVRIASHDLREPLNTIEQFSGLLDDDCGAQLPAPGRNYLRLVRRACGRMRTLLDDVVDYARLDFNDQQALVPVSLNALMEELRDALAGKLQSSQAQLHIGALPTVAGQASLLSLVFQNLLSNALKFVPPGRTPDVQVFATQEGNEHTITVKDNGIGIDAEHQTKIFDPFVRLHRREQFEGSGLGLAIAQRIVRAHGGCLEVVSSPGEQTGIEMRVHLPVL